jgi:uncharacterized membrane protein YdjX (TVP38/TMEM64 family)
MPLRKLYKNEQLNDYYIKKWFGTALIFSAIGLSAWELHSHMAMLIQWVQGLGTYVFIGFFLLYCFTVLFFLPIEPIVLASGALFGFYYGFLINLFCAVVSAAIAFMFSRYLSVFWISAQKKGRLIQWIERLESYGWKSLAISRLTPFLPCAIVNYGYGLTNIRLLVYTITNLIFFIPYKLIVTYIGSHL